MENMFNKNKQSYTTKHNKRKLRIKQRRNFHKDMEKIEKNKLEEFEYLYESEILKIKNEIESDINIPISNLVEIDLEGKKIKLALMTKDEKIIELLKRKFVKNN